MHELLAGACVQAQCTSCRALAGSTCRSVIVHCMQPSHLSNIACNHLISPPRGPLEKIEKKAHLHGTHRDTHAYPHDRIDTHAWLELKTSRHCNLRGARPHVNFESVHACMHVSTDRPIQEDPGRACTYVNDGYYYFSWTTPSNSNPLLVGFQVQLNLTTRMYSCEESSCPCKVR